MAIIHGNQDWKYNYFAAVGADDQPLSNSILIDAIAKEIAWRKSAVIGVIESSNIPVKHDATEIELVNILQDNLSKNKKLAQNLAKLLLGEKYKNSVGDVLGEAYVSVKGMIKPNTDLGKAQETGEALTGLLGSLFKAGKKTSAEQAKATQAQKAYELQQQQNKQLEEKVKLYSGVTVTQKRNNRILLVLLTIAVATGGVFIYRHYHQ